MQFDLYCYCSVPKTISLQNAGEETSGGTVSGEKNRAEIVIERTQ